MQLELNGALESSLCSSDSVLSCLPDDLSARYTHYSDLPLWKRDSLKLPGPTHTTKLGLALKDKGGFVFKASGGIEALPPQVHTQPPASLSGHLQATQGPGASLKGDVSSTEKPRMTSNGTHTTAMTGNTIPQGESLQWLGTDTPSSTTTGQQGTTATPTGTPAGGHQRPPATTIPSHSPRDSLPLLNPMGPAGINPAVASNPYRSEAGARAIYGSHPGMGYVGTTTSGSLSPYISPLYSPNPVPNPYYLPYPYTPSTSSLLQYSVDHNSPYSHILAQMQQPLRPSYLSGYNLPQNSPGPSIPRPLTPSGHLETMRKSPKQEDRRGSPKDTKGHHLSATPLSHRAPKHHRDSSQDTKDTSYMAMSSLHPAHYTKRSTSGLGSPTSQQRHYDDSSFARPHSIKQHPHLSVHEEPSTKRQRTTSGASRGDDTGTGSHGLTGSSQGGSASHSGSSQGASASYSRPPVDPSQPHYPPHFMKGSIIQLANGDLKRVEDLRTEDFVHSADISEDLKIDSSTVVRIDENIERGTALLGFSVGEHRVQVTVEATLEHPFFVFGQGWSSCNPERTVQRYGLSCHRLTVGDVCISLTHKDVSTAAQGAAKGTSSDRPRGATDFSAARLLSTTPRSRDISDYPRDLSLQRSQEATPIITAAAAAATSRPVRQRRWSAPDQYSPPSSAALSPSPLVSTCTSTSTTSRSIVAPPSIGSAGSATSSSRYSSPTRGHSPISVGREPAVTSSSGPTSPP